MDSLCYWLNKLTDIFMIYEFENTTDFIIEVDKIIGGKYFEHYFLIDAVSRIGHYQQEYYDSFIIGDSKNWILGFWFNGNYFVYGNDWTENQLNELKDRINFEVYQKGFHFNGTANLITELMENINYSIFKERLYYSNNKVVKVSKQENITELASLEYLDEVTQMICEYFEDEYHGKNNKDFSKMRKETESSIKKNSIWILKNEDVIVSMCSIISTPFNFPIIGSFFTKRENRNKGFGTKLMQDVTEFLKDKFDMVNLLAEKNNIESNIVFEKLNYKIVYKTNDFIIQ